MANDFYAQLRKQLGFLDNSCQAFDRGNKDEAVRIALCLRVLFHTSRNSKSILTHLNANNINLVNSSGKINEDVRKFRIYDGFMLFSYGPPLLLLNEIDAKEEIPFSDWWEQIMYVRNSIKTSRKDLVLMAANKDGGAHVDENLSPGYEELMNNFWQRHSMPITDTPLNGLRQLGFEVLNSNDLINLSEAG